MARGAAEVTLDCPGKVGEGDGGFSRNERTAFAGGCIAGVGTRVGWNLWGGVKASVDKDVLKIFVSAKGK